MHVLHYFLSKVIHWRTISDKVQYSKRCAWWYKYCRHSNLNGSYIWEADTRRTLMALNGNAGPASITCWDSLRWRSDCLMSELNDNFFCLLWDINDNCRCHAENVCLFVLFVEGDSFSLHLGQKFSTRDQDNDAVSHSCAVTFTGAWWYRQCHFSNLNGRYLRGNHTSFADGVNWYHWTGYYYSLRFTEMKIRPFNDWTEWQLSFCFLGRNFIHIMQIVIRAYSRYTCIVCSSLYCYDTQVYTNSCWPISKSHLG